MVTNYKAEKIKACSEKAAVTDDCHSPDPQPSGVPSPHNNSKSLDTLASSLLGFNTGQFSSGLENNIPSQGTQLEMLQALLQVSLANAGVSTQPPTFPDANFPTTDSTMQPKSYNKAGYSVVISNGTLCHANEEKGIVKMKTGTQFYIAIANINDFGELNTHLDNTYFQNTTVIENSVVEIFSVFS